MKKNLLSLFKQRVILLFVAALFMSIDVFSQTAGYVWNNAPIGGGGFVTGIITHKTSGDPELPPRCGRRLPLGCREQQMGSANGLVERVGKRIYWRGSVGARSAECQ